MGKSWGEAGVAGELDDATRDACLHHLGDHYAEGRLSAAELDSWVQLVLAAETETDLASIMAGVEGEPEAVEEAQHASSDQRAIWLRVPGLRWAAAAAVLASGGAFMAAAAPRSDSGAFAAGLVVALLGFLAHWAVSTRSGRTPEDQAAPGSPVLDLTQTAAGGHPPDHDAEPEPGEPQPVGPTHVLIPRRVRNHGGAFPSQRTGD